MVHRFDYCDVQRIVHHVVEVEHREARVEVGGNARSADLAMPSARAAASCAASPRAGVHRHARVTEGIFTAPAGLFFVALQVCVASLRTCRRAGAEETWLDGYGK